MNKNDNCLANVLKVIVTLQNNVHKLDCLNNSCNKPFLGNNDIKTFNTRLVTFYNCSNKQISLPYQDNHGSVKTSNVFRIQKVCDNTVTVLLLEKGANMDYVSTNTCAILNLNCICAIQCIGDTTINNI